MNRDPAIDHGLPVAATDPAKLDIYGEPVKEVKPKGRKNGRAASTDNTAE